MYVIGRYGSILGTIHGTVDSPIFESLMSIKLCRFVSFVVVGCLLTVFGCRSRDKAPDSATAGQSAGGIPIPASGVATPTTSPLDTTSSAHVCDDDSRAFAHTRPAWARADEFLDRLKAGAPTDNFKLETAHFPPAATILAYIADSGITYVDLNGFGPTAGDTVRHVSTTEIQRQLENKAGPFFKSLSYMAYSEIEVNPRRSYCPIADGVSIFVGSGNRVTFRTTANMLQLVKFEFFAEGD